MLIWPGTKANRANVTPSLLCDQCFYMVQMAEGSDEGYKYPVSPAVTDHFTSFSVFPLFNAALQSK